MPHPYTLLIVDDHALQLEYLRKLFQSSGAFQVETSSSGRDALAFAKSVKFDLILLDMMMPELDGVQLIRRLAELPAKPALAIMSASSDRLLNSACVMAEVLGLRVLGQIAKPVRPGDVGWLVSRLKALSPVQPQERLLPNPDRAAVNDALENGQIRTWYQPKVDLATGAVVGAEALARWILEDGTVLLPGQFLPAITALRFEEALLACVLEQTIAAQRGWSAQGIQVPVSINLPPHLFDDEELPDKIRAWTRAAGGIPGAISFELTEESTARSQGNFFAGACRLRMMGFGLAQDDFSQGYSSLYNLISTPFTELKIDRSLVAGCVDDDGARAAVESAVALGKRLGITVVAEGVESVEQFDYLRAIDCDAVQGFYLAGALSADLFSQFARTMRGQTEWPRSMRR